MAVRIVQHARHAAIEQRVAEEFQPLIVVGAGAAVGQRGVAQGGLHENVTERLLDPGRQIVRLTLRNHCTRTVLSKCTVSDTLPT